MARKEEPAKGQTNANALLGSGRKIDPADKAEAARKKRQAQPWQEKAWDCVYTVPEITFAMTLVDNVLRRGRLTVAVPDDEGGEPVIVDREEADEGAKAAFAAVDRLAASDGGQGALLGALGIGLTVPGEAYLVGWHPDGGDVEEWDVFSPQQVHVEENGQASTWYLKTAPGQTAVESMTQLGPDDFICRVWRRDPQWRDLAFSSMRPLIDICEDLRILTRTIRATALSQIAGAGMLLVPDEISFGPTDPTEQSGDGNDPDPLTQDLLAVMAAPIEDPSSPAGTVPLVVRGPGDHLTADKFRHLSFARTVDPEQAKQRDELLKRIANGLDMPAEMVLGAGDMNHWNLWVIDGNAFDQHFEPLLSLICWALTSGYLRPALKGGPGEDKNFLLWFDASGMVKHPNIAADAQDALDAAAIGYDSYRAAKGFGESDAMGDEDFTRWKDVQAAKRASTPFGGTPSDAAADTVEPIKAMPDTTPDDGADPLPPESIQGSGRDRLPVGSSLVEIERIVRTRLQDAADAAMGSALERAGAKLRRKAGTRGMAADIARGVDDNRMVARALGRIVVSQWFADDTDVLDTRFLALRPKWDGLTLQAQRRVAQLARDEGADIDVEDYVAAHDHDREAGWQMLVAGLSGLAALRLYDPDPIAPPLGEVDLVSTVPVSIVRGALSRAGGANGRISPTGAMLVHDPSGREVPAGGIATGPDALSLLEKAGLSVTSMLWSTGAPDRPFEPHQSLDGVEFSDWGDEALSADPGEFPFVSVYAPQDHEGCQCDALPVLEAVAVDVPESEAA